MTNAKVHQGFCDDKMLKSTVLHSTPVLIFSSSNDSVFYPVLSL